MKLIKHVFITTIIITICSCATVNYIPKNYSGVDAGYAIVSIGHTKKTKYCSYKLLIRTKDKTAQNAVHYMPRNYTMDNGVNFENNKIIGSVELLKLPPGDYEIYNVDVFENLGLFQTNYRAEKEFSIPFTIKPNETIYLGEYIAVNIGGNFLGASIGGAYFIVKDKTKRDIEYIKNDYPSTKLGKIINVVPIPEEIGCPLLRADEYAKE